MTTMHAHSLDVLNAALEAYDAGLCVVRARTDGTKAPLGQWLQYQHERPTRLEVERWFEDGYTGLGVICGAVSGDLEMFELEGRFMAETDGGKRFASAMKAAGHELLLKRLVNGLMVASPSDGRHFYYRVTGAVDGNTKLARNVANETMIETRGEGGFVIVAPSWGGVHPTGKPWRKRGGSFATIPTITVAEREALFAVARSFDESPKPAPVTPVASGQRLPVSQYAGAHVGDSWMDATVAHLRDTWTMRSLLEHYGWTYAYTDRHGRELMTRPGKEDGVSASVNESGRMHPFSTSIPFEVGGTRQTTYDLLDVIAAYEHGGDRQAAGRAVAEVAGIRRAHVKPSSPPSNVDPVTGEITQTPQDMLGDAFWTARPELAHIRQAARSRLVAPTAVLGAVLARIAAFTPPSSCVPPLVGGEAPLSLYIAFRGRSGAGKSSPVSAATALLPDIPPGCAGPLALGSGEGLVEAYLELVEETDDNGKKRKVKHQTRHGVLFMLDEGQALGEMASRKGSTIMPTLRTAWSGGDPGQANASAETRRSLPSNSYALGLISLWQDKAAAQLLADVDGGTPQRFVWMPTDDPGASADTPPWPGRLTWIRPPMMAMGGRVQPNPLDVHPSIAREVAEARAAGLRLELELRELDAHRLLNKLKLAGVLAILNGRHNIDLEDWDLAERVLTMSDSVRDWVVSEASRRRAEAEDAVIQRTVTRDAVVEKSAADRALVSAARATYRAVVRGGGEPVGRRDIARAIASRDRAHVTIDDAIAETERLLWVTRAGVPDAWVEGKARPS